jgi:hypothetical protein
MKSYFRNFLFNIGFLSPQYFHIKKNIYFDILNFKPKTLSPNFLIIGAMKAGTTSLYNYLTKHPDIFLSVIKEPGYFLNPSDQTFRPEYKSANYVRFNLNDTLLLKKMLRGYRGQKMIGEASTHYTKIPEFGWETPKKCFELNPQMKFIYIIRHPLDRMISQYLHALKGKFTQAKFNEVIREDISYQNFSMYYLQLARYLEYFDKSQFKLIIFEEFIQNPLEGLQDIASFLKVIPFKTDNLTFEIFNASSLKGKMHKSEFYYTEENFEFFKEIFEADIYKLTQIFPLPVDKFWDFDPAKYVEIGLQS